MKLLLGRKLNMSQSYAENGDVVPVTRIRVGKAVVTQVKNKEKDGYTAVQFGFNEGSKHVTKPVSGHVKGAIERPKMREMRIEETGSFETGQSYGIESFAVGEKVTVAGTSKGQGFQGVVKRHHFAGAPKTHGHKHDLRAPGSIGSTDAQRVFPGKRMAGRMGGSRVSVINLTIAAIDAAEGIISICGAVPGPRNGLVEIRGTGDMKATASGTGQKAEEPAKATEETTQ